MRYNEKHRKLVFLWEKDRREKGLWKREWWPDSSKIMQDPKYWRHPTPASRDFENWKQEYKQAQQEKARKEKFMTGLIEGLAGLLIVVGMPALIIGAVTLTLVQRGEFEWSLFISYTITTMGGYWLLLCWAYKKGG